MLFLMRCAFWLSIVYASILLPKGTWRDLTRQTVGAVDLQGATRQAVAGAARFCGTRAALCVGEAARLTALIETTGRDDDAAAAPMPVTSSEPVPAPVPRPRHLGDAETMRKP